MNLRCKPPAADQLALGSDVVAESDFIKYYKADQGDRIGFQDSVYHERLQTYSIPAFVNDLSRGLGIERYTERDISQEGFSGVYGVFRTEEEEEKKEELMVVGTQVDVQTLKETKYETGYTLLENIVLLSYGRITPSMTNHLLKLEDDGVELRDNFYAFEKVKHTVHDKQHFYQYAALRTLYSIGAKDIEAFD